MIMNITIHITPSSYMDCLSFCFGAQPSLKLEDTTVDMDVDAVGDWWSCWSSCGRDGVSPGVPGWCDTLIVTWWPRGVCQILLSWHMVWQPDLTGWFNRRATAHGPHLALKVLTAGIWVRFHVSQMLKLCRIMIGQGCLLLYSLRSACWTPGQSHFWSKEILNFSEVGFPLYCRELDSRWVDWQSKPDPSY